MSCTFDYSVTTKESPTPKTVYTDFSSIQLEVLKIINFIGASVCLSPSCKTACVEDHDVYLSILRVTAGNGNLQIITSYYTNVIGFRF